MPGGREGGATESSHPNSRTEGRSFRRVKGCEKFPRPNRHFADHTPGANDAGPVEDGVLRTRAQKKMTWGAQAAPGICRGLLPRVEPEGELSAGVVHGQGSGGVVPSLPVGDGGPVWVAGACVCGDVQPLSSGRGDARAEPERGQAAGHLGDAIQPVPRRERPGPTCLEGATVLAKAGGLADTPGG